MSTPVGSSQWMYATAAGFYPYLIDQSLRFDGSSSTLHRTPSAAGNQRTWTWSCWFKRSVLGTYQNLFGTDYNTGGNYGGYIAILDTNKLRVYSNLSGSVQMHIDVDMLFRDVSSFYHLLVAFDSTEASAGDRVKVYVNGSLVTYTTTTAPALNLQGQLNDGERHDVGSFYVNGSPTWHWNGYMAEVNFIDGTALDPTSFGETINNIWVPKEVSGLTYGTNGFYLSFADSSAIGDDLSGNTNDFTANNLAASDVVPDSPTNNFPVLIPGFTQTTQEGGLKLKRSSSGNLHTGCFSTMGVSSGKWYVEIKYEDSGIDTVTFGVAETEGGFDPTVDGTAYVATSGISSNTHMEFATWSVEAKLSSSYAGTLGSPGSYGSSPSSGDIIQIALDMDDKKIWYGVNGTYIASGDPANGSNPSQSGSAFNPTGDVVFVASAYMGRDFSISFNFGQDSANVSSANSDENGIGTFEYAPPSGFLALCSANLPEPDIGPNSAEQADGYFNTVLWSGDGNDGRTITGVGFQPDWVWVKDRNTARSHVIQDSVRGFNDGDKVLRSNGTNSESSTDNDVFGFVGNTNSDGYTLEDGTTDGRYVNNSGETYVAWNWKAGGAAVSNTDGSITSSVSAAPDAGFSIVSYTGTGANATVGHGLSSAPEFVIVKERNGTGQWSVQSTGLSAANKVVHLQSTAAEATKADHFNSTFPTSTVFSLGTSGNTNGNTNTFIAYCFHSSDICKVGSYVGNGSADGTFVYTGFRPAWVMIKSSSLTYGWVIVDTVRNTYNVINSNLFPHASAAEDSSTGYFNIDAVSNGFKVRTSNAVSNQSGGSYIYLAFADGQPFKYANAR